MIIGERAAPEQTVALPCRGLAKQLGRERGYVDAILDGGPVETSSHGREIISLTRPRGGIGF
jgi:hypothetical protein